MVMRVVLLCNSFVVNDIGWQARSHDLTQKDTFSIIGDI